MQRQNPIASRAQCLERDAADPLRNLRERFALRDGLIYLDGNSLGPLPRAAMAGFERAIRREWGEDLILSWNKAGWFDKPSALGDRLGAWIGAGPGQTVVCDTTSINVFKAVHAAMALNPSRDVIVAEAGSFPTDLYVVEGVMAAAGRPLTRRLVDLHAPDERWLDARLGAALLNVVDYRTGRMADVAGLTRKIHAAGGLVIWDLCHSAGVIDFAFDALGVDFAVGCTYKYLNGGPGAPAFIAVAKQHQERAANPLSGWWGHAAPFEFQRDYVPAQGIRRFLCGTQPILSMRGVEAGLDAVEGVAIADLRAKSLALTGLFMARVAALAPQVEILTPWAEAERGSQVALGFARGYAVVQAMIGRGVIGDFREPGLMRFGFAPAYNGFADVWDAAEILASCLRDEVWRDERHARRSAVT